MTNTIMSIRGSHGYYEGEAQFMSPQNEDREQAAANVGGGDGPPIPRF